MSSFNIILKVLYSDCFYLSQEVFYFVRIGKKKVQFYIVPLRELSSVVVNFSYS